jgi:hypothetical protein
VDRILDRELQITVNDVKQAWFTNSKNKVQEVFDKFQILRILAISQDLAVIFWRMVTVVGGP